MIVVFPTLLNETEN